MEVDRVNGACFVLSLSADLEHLMARLPVQRLPLLLKSLDHLYLLTLLPILNGPRDPLL